MKTSSLTKSNNELWLLMAKVNHELVLVRQEELRQYQIPMRQLHALRCLEALGSKATIAEMARMMERRLNVISRQAVRMENAGLIKRTQSTPRSNLLNLELTEKGKKLLKISTKSKENTIDAMLSFLSQEERRQMESILNRILKQLNKYALEKISNKT